MILFNILSPGPWGVGESRHRQLLPYSDLMSLAKLLKF